MRKTTEYCPFNRFWKIEGSENPSEYKVKLIVVAVAVEGKKSNRVVAARNAVAKRAVVLIFIVGVLRLALWFRGSASCVVVPGSASCVWGPGFCICAVAPWLAGNCRAFRSLGATVFFRRGCDQNLSARNLPLAVLIFLVDRYISRKVREVREVLRTLRDEARQSDPRDARNIDDRFGRSSIWSVVVIIDKIDQANRNATM